MYVHLGLFRTALVTSLFRRPFRLRRWAMVLGFCALFWTVWILVALGRGLDWILFPGFRRQVIREPTFIIAPPRSGTTFLQQLMSQDEHRFACVRLYETIFPSVTWLRLFDLVGWVDRRLGGFLARGVRWFERRAFGGWDEVHRMSFTAPEEDECYFVYTMVAEALLLLFPFPEELWLATRADRLPERSRHALMKHYRSCIRRHMYARGPHKTLLAKNPGSAGRIRAILETFPDARIVSIVRHPYESLPSHVSSFYRAWQVHSPEIEKVSDVTAAYAEVAVDWYRNIYECRDLPSPERHVTVRYEELVTDPRAAVRAVYTHFGWELDPEFVARLDASARRARGYRSEHSYALGEYGLSPEWVQERLGDVMDAYALER